MNLKEYLILNNFTLPSYIIIDGNIISSEYIKIGTRHLSDGLYTEKNPSIIVWTRDWYKTLDEIEIYE